MINVEINEIKRRLYKIKRDGMAVPLSPPTHSNAVVINSRLFYPGSQFVII